MSILVYLNPCVMCGGLIGALDRDSYYCSDHSGTGKVERVSDVPKKEED